MSERAPPSRPLRLAFFGSPPFAVPALDALREAGHEIVRVYAQPPRPAGRGRHERRAAVHERADALGIPVRTPARLRAAEQEWDDFAALRLDAAVVAAYGLILPPAMLAAPRRGCLNIHASLLPRWRGAAPIQAALRAGDPDTGISIMQMDRGLDTGPVLFRRTVRIEPRETAPSLHDKLSALGARAIVDALDTDPPSEAQAVDGVTHAPPLTRADGTIDWHADADAIDRQIRALLPWPGTATTLPGGDAFKILVATPAAADGGGSTGAAPGTVLDEAGQVACGTGVLRLERVQVAGRPPTDAAAFLRGRRLPPGARLGP